MEGGKKIIDQISELPEHVLQHIMSFLLVKDVINASLVSKNFYNAWRTLPYLNFRSETFSSAKIVSDYEMQELLNRVDDMITMKLNGKTNIEKFRLELPAHFSEVSPYINRFVGSITEGNIKELVFKVSNAIGKWPYTLPEAVYAAKSLDKLELGGFKLNSPSSGIKFSSLRKLALYRAYLDNNLIQLLVSSCPNLEILDFMACEGFNSLQISGLLKLKKVYLYSFDGSHDFKIEIQAPCLEHLYYYGSGRLAQANLNACKSLKRLILHKSTVPVNWADDLLSNLPLLETFGLLDCEGLETIRISSNRLKKLILWNCVNLVRLELDTPNLSLFQYLGDLSINLLLKASANQHLGVGPPVNAIRFHNKLLEFLGKFNNFKAVSLIFLNPEKAIVAKGTRVNFCSPLYGVKYLSLDSYEIIDKSMFLAVLDSLLWIAPCLDSLSLVNSRFKSSMQFIHENPKDEVEADCCSSMPVYCWRHNLKRVKCKNMKGIADEEKLKNYFFKNAKTLESVDFVAECDS